MTLLRQNQLLLAGLCLPLHPEQEINDEGHTLRIVRVGNHQHDFCTFSHIVFNWSKEWMLKYTKQGCETITIGFVENEWQVQQFFILVLTLLLRGSADPPQGCSQHLLSLLSRLLMICLGILEYPLILTDSAILLKIWTNKSNYFSLKTTLK